MTEIQAIAVSLVALAFLFSHYAWKFNDSEDKIIRALSILMFTISYFFGVSLIWLASQIAENTAPYSTWIAPGLPALITVLVWVGILLVIIFFARFVILLMRILVSWFKRVAGIPTEDDADQSEGGL